MTAPIDITGERYGRLVALNRVENRNRRTRWLFACDCGAQPTVALEAVRGGLTRSCGCQNLDSLRARSLTHGHSINRKSSRTLKSYNHAKSRCINPNDPKFPHYGGRGITMCSDWLADFANFLGDMGECPPELTLDRIDVHKGYEPGNCRWATASQQARTRTDNVLVEHNGSTMVLKDFAAYMGVNYKSLHQRVKYKGQSALEAAVQLKATA